MLHLKIINLDGEYLNKEVDFVNVVTTAGELTILDNHQPIITNVCVSRLYISLNGKETYFSIAGGTLFVSEKECKIITSAIENVDDIDFERADAAKNRAEERLNNKKQDIDITRAEAALKRALNRLSMKNYL